MHALESLLQLTDVRGPAAGPRQIASAPVHITDAPLYPYRGLLIDTGNACLLRQGLPLAYDCAHAMYAHNHGSAQDGTFCPCPRSSAP